MRDAPDSGTGRGGRFTRSGGRFLPGGGPMPRGPRYRGVRRVAAIALGVAIVGFTGGVLVIWDRYETIAAHLPSVKSLKDYQPPTVSRIYAGDDRLMAELAAERRIYVPIMAIPDRVKNAFVAAEDQHFYTHRGIDPLAILRAEMFNLTRPEGRRPIGASTITQQVARNMVLDSNALTIERKIEEAMLAIRIEQTLSKDKILEIYLNGIYLGGRAYGVAAAAQTFFNKTLDQLTDAEAATLAALPKSPSNYDPFRHPEAAVARRNWVLGRMLEIGALTPDAARAAEAEPLVPHNKERFGPLPNSEWFGSEVRRQLIEKYGETIATRSGLEVHTSLDPALQNEATRILREGLMTYDRSHGGWRGAVGHVTLPSHSTTDDAWVAALQAAKPPAGMLDRWRLGVILSPAAGKIGWIEGGEPRTGTLLGADAGWMRLFRYPHAGDLVLIEPQADGGVAIRQIPQVEGALVTMDVRTGRVLAMVGGWSFRDSQFNRATQALRQPGSSFKPFVYLAAMEKGVPPSEKFDDGPVSYGDWHPKNYEKDNWGPTTLHDALRESRNLVTIRLAAYLGMKAVADMAVKAGLVEKMPHVLPAALGAVETTVMREAAAYASIAAGGHIVVPSLIDTVQDREGTVIWKQPGLTLGTMMQPPAAEIHLDAPPAVPPAVAAAQPAPGAPPLTPVVAPAAPAVPPAGSIEVPEIKDDRPHMASEDSTFQIVTMMQDVIARGTGTLAGQGIDREIAGKTGTSQDFHDAWFAGFSPDLVTVVWVGFDQPQSLGKNEDGGRIAGPIWNKMMKVALASRPKLSFRAPPDMVLARYSTGRLMAVDAFKPDQVPGMSIALHGFGAGTEALTAADTGAENISDTETDMAEAPAAQSSPGISAAPGAASGRPPPAQTGDIGVGGLY
ncbi:penicillin-binding protein 1A [Acidomonas methanolica]|uniref:penicillin-binding protein 1A n=1 Tax=Acidomonas methanolica TaxID=437 RepID=UPI00351D20ED